MPLVAWLYWIRESHRLNWTHPEFHPTTPQDLKLISKRCEITTCHQHRLIPDLPSVNVVTITFLFFGRYQFFEISMRWIWYLVFCFFGLTLIPADTLFVLDRRANEHRPAVCPPSRTKINTIQNHVSTCCSTHLLLCCAVRWKIVFWV